MNLKQSIRRILREEYTDKQKKLLTLASQVGFLSTSKITGGVESLFNILGDDFLNNKNNKIMIVKEIVNIDKLESLTLYEMGEKPITISNEGGILKQLYILYPEDVLITHSELATGREIRETSHLYYEELPKDILDEIFTMVINYYVDNIERR